MLLCIDIGNTNIVLGLYRGDSLVTHWRISTDHERMPDEYAMTVVNLFAHAGYSFDQVEDTIIASVVPSLTERFEEMVRGYLGQDPLVVGTGTRTGVAIRYDRPQEVGADRIVNVAAAFRQYGGRPVSWILVRARRLTPSRPRESISAGPLPWRACGCGGAAFSVPPSCRY